MLTIHWVVFAALLVFSGCVGVIVAAVLAVAASEGEKTPYVAPNAMCEDEEGYGDGCCYRPENAVLYNGHPDSGSIRRR